MKSHTYVNDQILASSITSWELIGKEWKRGNQPVDKLTLDNSVLSTHHYGKFARMQTTNKTSFVVWDFDAWFDGEEWIRSY